MRAIGIKINIQNSDANVLGNNLSSGGYQIAEFAWSTTPFVSGNQPIYCSYTNANACGYNWTQSASARVDALMSRGSSATSTSEEIGDYNKADAILWRNMVTLPLYQASEFYDWSNNLQGVLPNTSATGITWNAEDWRISS
jgi:peptide/nickel transport system substrate-binding protein